MAQEQLASLPSTFILKHFWHALVKKILLYEEASLIKKNFLSAWSYVPHSYSLYYNSKNTYKVMLACTFTL